MKLSIALLAAFSLFLVACGDDGSGNLFGPEPGDDAPSSAEEGSSEGGSLTDAIAPCELITEAELTAVVGRALAPEESEPAGPFTGCSWGTGTVLISLATTDNPILAPGQEEDCPTAGIGDRSFICPGKVTVLVGGIQYSVSTIDAFIEQDVLINLAAIVEPKLASP